MPSESARMASAAEARFRIDAPNDKSKRVKVIALDRPSEAVVKHYWPDVNPIGRRIQLRPNAPWLTIAGVCGDRKDWFSGEAQPAAYVSYQQWPTPYCTDTGVGRPTTTIVPCCAKVGAAGRSETKRWFFSSIVGDDASVITGSMALGSVGDGVPVSALVTNAS